MAYIYPEESKKLLGIAMQLHRELGCGFKEKVYQDAFEVLLRENNIPFDKDDNVVDMRIDFSMYPQEVGDIDWSFVKDTTGDEIMSFVYYFLHPSKGAGYVRTWFKTKISGI